MTGTVTPTDWTRYDVPALAAILDQDHSLAWDQVIAWRTCYELIDDESTRLTQARAELADAWPPERSPAAAMYLSYLDLVIESMTDTCEAAIANSTALSSVLLALAETRTTIDQLHGTWQLYAEREQFNASTHPYGMHEGVPQNWAETLNAQAHKHMADTDQTIFDNARRLIAPEILEIFGPFGEFAPLPGSGIDAARGITPTQRIHVLPRTAVAGWVARQGSGSEPLRSPELSSDHGGISDPTPPVRNGPFPSTSGMSAAGTGWSAPLVPLVGSAVAAIVPKIGARGAATRGPQPGLDPASDRELSNESVGRNASPIGSSDRAPAAISPGMGPIGGGANRGTRKRRTGHRAAWPIPKGGPSLIEPKDDLPVVHDPGPGVIGIDL